MSDRPRPIIDRYPVVDWSQAFASATGDGGPWIVDQLVADGSSSSIFATAGIGKSLFTLELSACVATGRPFAGLTVPRQRTVLYVDRENSLEDVVDRLRTFRFTPDQLGRLRFASFPTLPALDHPDGGRELLELALAHGADLVVIDTLAVSVVGSENESDTIRAYARHTGGLLRAAGVAVVRLDHAGKNADRGQRGSSAKDADVDTVWRLDRLGTGEPQRFRLTTGTAGLKKRSRHGLDRLDLHRIDGRLRQPARTHHEDTAPEGGVAATAALLDALDVPIDWGRRKAGEALRDAGHSIRDAVIMDAVRARRDRCPTGADGEVSGTGTPAAPEPVRNRSGTAGNRGDGTPLADRFPRPPDTQVSGAGTGQQSAPEPGTETRTTAHDFATTPATLEEASR